MRPITERQWKKPIMERQWKGAIMDNETKISTIEQTCQQNLCISSFSNGPSPLRPAHIIFEPQIHTQDEPAGLNIRALPACSQVLEATALKSGCVTITLGSLKGRMHQSAYSEWCTGPHTHMPTESPKIKPKWIGQVQSRMPSLIANLVVFPIHRVQPDEWVEHKENTA